MIARSPYFNPSETRSSSGKSLFRTHFAALMLATALAPGAMTILPDAGGRFGIVAAQAQQSVSIDRIEIPFVLGAFVLTGVTATNSSLNKNEIESLLKGTDLKATAALLQRFNADSLAAKSIDLIVKQDGIDQKTTYDTVEAKNIKAGLVDLFTVRETRQSGRSTVEGKSELPYTMTTGKMSVEKFDIAGFFRLMTESDPTGKAPMKQLHGRYEIDFMQMVFGDAANVRIGKMSASGFSARLPRKPITELLALAKKADAAKDDKKAKDEIGLQILAQAIDLYSAVQIGDGQVDGITIKGKDKGQEINGSVGKIAFMGGKAPKGVVSDIDFKTSEGFFKLKSASIEGDFYGTMLIAFQQVMATAPKNSAGNPALEAELRQMVAEAAAKANATDVGYRFEGLDADLPPSKDGKSKERVKLSIAGFHGFVGKFVGYMPTKLDISLKNFRMPVPSDSKDQGIRTLREVGITTLDLMTGVKLAWDEATSRVTISELGGEIDKFAKLSVAGEIANIPRAIFENPQTNWPIAMMGGSAQKLSVSLENKGGLENFIAKVAKDQGKTPEQFRVEISTIAPAMIGAFLSAHPDAATLSDAIGKFTKGLGAFSIVARGATPAGITAADIMAAGGNPAALLQKVRFEAQGR